jgi:ketosteroid isomerase-like protein
MSTAARINQSSNDEAEIRALIASVGKAHHDKDAAAILAPHAQDSVVFNLAPPLAHRGTNLPEKQTWLDTWDGPIELESRDFRIAVSGDLAFAYGFYRMGGKNKYAPKPVEFWMRATLCLARNNDAWQIVHEHTSVPFYMDGSLRPAFDLQPQIYTLDMQGTNRSALRGDD